VNEATTPTTETPPKTPATVDTQAPPPTGPQGEAAAPPSPDKHTEQAEQDATKTGLPTKLLGLLKTASSTAKGSVPSPGKLKIPLHAPPTNWYHKLAVPILVLATASIISAVSLKAGSAEGPDFDGALDSVEARLDASRFDEALELLNQPIGQRILTDEATEAHRARFYILSAEALYFAQQRKGIDLTSNHERIAAFYRAARDKHNATLTDDETERLARSLAAVPDTLGAVNEARRIEATRPRIALLRELIENDLNAAEPELAAGEAKHLIHTIATGDDANESDRLWAAEWRARFLLREGEDIAAVDRLLTRIHTLERRDTPAAARLFALLGHAYVNAGHPLAARPHLEHALQHLPSHAPAAAEAQVFLARVLQAAGDIERAADRFTNVVQSFPQTGPGALATLGLAEIASSQSDHEAADAFFREALNAVNNGSAGAFLTRQQLIERIRAAFDRLRLEKDNHAALLFATTLEAAHPQPTPPSVIRNAAETHADIASELLNTTPLASDGLPKLSETDPRILERAREHHFQAAGRFREVATRTMANQPEDAAQALWNAADSYDKAGSLARATAAFAEYVQLRGADDPRQVTALYRLARAHQAAGEHQKAIQTYERLLAEHPTADEAYRAYVPIARSYLLLDTDEGDRAAERHLRTVVEGQLIEPDAPEFREALIELGRLYLRSERHDNADRYALAIQHLTAAHDRYPDLANDPALLISLANANRLSALAIDEDLALHMRPSERERLRQTKRHRLAHAINLYDTVEEITREQSTLADSPETHPPTRLLRDSLLHHADAAFALAKHLEEHRPTSAEAHFKDAITHYDAVARRFPDDQIALVAMVQIVNAHVRLGNWQHARTAQRKARARLDQLPRGILDQPSSLMSRQQWEDWLDSTLHLDALAGADTITNTP